MQHLELATATAVSVQLTLLLNFQPHQQFIQTRTPYLFVLSIPDNNQRNKLPFPPLSIPNLQSHALNGIMNCLFTQLHHPPNNLSIQWYFDSCDWTINLSNYKKNITSFSMLSLQASLTMRNLFFIIIVPIRLLTSTCSIVSCNTEIICWFKTRSSPSWIFTIWAIFLMISPSHTWVEFVVPFFASKMCSSFSWLSVAQMLLSSSVSNVIYVKQTSSPFG